MVCLWYSLHMIIYYVYYGAVCKDLYHICMEWFGMVGHELMLFVLWCRMYRCVPRIIGVIWYGIVCR